MKALQADLAEMFSVAYREIASRPDCTARDLLSRYADLAAHTKYALELIYEEYCREISKRPDLSTNEFLLRYPEYSTQLRRMFSVHSGIADPAVIKRLEEIRWPTEGETHGDFQLVERIGRGAFSSVYLARQLSVDGRNVVVKLTANSNVEVAALSRLNHGNIVPIYTVSALEPIGLNAICMPYFGRVTLFDVLQAAHGEETPPKRASELLAVLPFALDPNDADDTDAEAWNEAFDLFVMRRAIQLLEALEVSHSQGVFHCDLKPSNVLVDNQANARLIDFNLAQTSGEGRTGGTLPYMAPEQLRTIAKSEGDQTLSAKTDLYGWGVTIGQLLTGELPHIDSDELGKCELQHADSARSLLERQQNGIAAWCEKYRNVSPVLVDTIQEAMSFDAAERPGSAGELAKRFRRHVDQDSEPTQEKKYKELLARVRRRQRRLILGGIGAGLAVVVTGRLGYVLTKRTYYEAAAADFRNGQTGNALKRYDLRKTKGRYSHSLIDLQEISFFHVKLILEQKKTKVDSIGSVNAWSNIAESTAEWERPANRDAVLPAELVPTRLNWVCYLLNNPDATDPESRKLNLRTAGDQLGFRLPDSQHESSYEHAIARWHFDRIILRNDESGASMETAISSIHKAIASNPRVDDVFLDAAAIELVDATFPDLNGATDRDFDNVRATIGNAIYSISSMDRKKLLSLIDDVENSQGTHRIRARNQFLEALRQQYRKDTNLLVPSNRLGKLIRE